MKPKFFQSCETRLWKWSLKPGLETELRAGALEHITVSERAGRILRRKQGSAGSVAATSFLQVPQQVHQSPKSLSGHERCWDRAEDTLGRLLMHGVAAIGTGFRCALTLLGLCCCGTRIGQFSVEVSALTQIPGEGPIRLRFLLSCSAAIGVCFTERRFCMRSSVKGRADREG